jgi:2-polyprenyl-3-methyl-5-hydroxy-6-metoxy-1,4-benzoquinol methylase
MNKKKELQWQRNVLKDFKKKSPSKINIENKKVFKRYLDNHLNLFNENLKFPIEIFKNKRILDLGCGTGEVDIILNSFGAKCYGFDFNEISIDRANFLKKKYKLKNIFFKKKKVEDLKIKKASYDISISFGVIAHIYNREKLFKKLVNATKKDGYIILGYVEDGGLIQRLLHRAIIRKINENNNKDIFILAKKIFSEHIKRSVKFGLRSEEGIINDYLVNQAYIGISMDQMLSWQKKYKLKFYSKSPDATLPLRIDPGFQDNILNHNTSKELYSLSNLRSVFSMKSDQDIFNNIFFKNKLNVSSEINFLIKKITKILQKKVNKASKKELLEIKKIKAILSKKLKKLTSQISIDTNKNFNSYTKEIIDIIYELSKKKFSFKSLNKKINYLFKGYNGLGTSYIVFKKK